MTRDIGRKQRGGVPFRFAATSENGMAKRMNGADAPVLWHLKVSHYNEKARWSLDYKGVPHIRRAVLPGAHRKIARELCGGRTFPVLVLDGNAIGDSTDIIAALERRHPDPPLYPSEPAARRRSLELEDFFDEQLGPYTRLIAIHLMLTDPGLFLGAFAPDLSVGRRLYARAVFPQVRRRVSSSLGIDDAAVEHAYRKVRAAGERFRAELHPSGYLGADGFSVADLTLAALVSRWLRRSSSRIHNPSAGTRCSSRSAKCSSSRGSSTGPGRCMRGTAVHPRRSRSSASRGDARCLESLREPRVAPERHRLGCRAGDRLLGRGAGCRRSRQWGPVPLQPLAIVGEHQPAKISDAIGFLLQRLVFGDLTPYGIPRAPEGYESKFRRKLVGAAVDDGFVQALKAGRTRVVPQIERFEGREIVLADGTRIAPDAVICATGYRRGLEPIVGHLGVLRPDGLPIRHAGAPRLYFAGFWGGNAGQLRWSPIHARRIARAAARDRTRLAEHWPTQRVRSPLATR